MSAPIPYTVQSGETLQDIARKLDIKDWTKLQKYHNDQASSDQKTSTTPYAGFKLMTPPQDEIYTLNGETPPPDPAEEQKTAEQKQDQEKKKEEEEKKNEQATKSDHDGKYFVVHDAKCVCDKAENPKQTANLQVTTHAIIVLNDEQGKLAATEEDKTFNPPAATFGKCTLKPSSGGYLPCALAPAPKWGKTYESTQVMGKNTLTEISELQCTVGGKITIFNHGQADSVSNAHADNTNPVELAMVNPAVEQPKKKEEYPAVTSITLHTIENRITFKEIDSKNKNGVIYLRKDEEASFKANLKSGNKQFTSWMVYSDHQGKKESRILLREQIGTEFSQSFDGLGKFRIEGYGKPKTQEFEKGKYDKCDPTCSIDVEVVENTLMELECTSADFTTRIDPSKNRKFRKGVPSVFKAKFFIPDLTAEEKSRLTLSVLDGTESTITEGVQTHGETLTFTPKNSKAKYTIVARYTNEQGETIEKKMSGETESNAVLGISHGAEVVRPGTAMSFSVSKMKYKFGNENSPFSLSADEASEIKWNLNGVLQATGKNITIPGFQLMVPGKYIVEAYSITANATGKNAKKEDDDWHFEVKENIVTEIKAGKKARTGSEIPFEISKTLLNGYDPAKDGTIVWKVTGPASGTGSGEKFNYKFTLPGEYTINCLMGGRSSQTPLKLKIIQPKILTDTSKWIDNDGNSGNIIKEAGYGQEVCAFVKYEGLQGEEMTLQIYDNDSNGVNLVHNIEGTLSETSSGVYWPFTLDNSIKQKIEAKGLTKDGKLHFKLAPKDTSLQILNGAQSLGEYLKVSNVPKIVDGYFCDAGDTEKLYNSPIDKPLYFKVYAINMVDKKVEVHFMTQSDPYFGFAWSAKQWKDWKDVKEKFAKETFFHTAEGTINKKGELIVKVDPSKLGKPKNYFKIAAVVKITEGEGKDAIEKAAYLEKTDLAILYATAKLPDMVENKGAVKVGRETLSKKGENKNGVCECEARVRAFIRMVRVGEGTGEVIKSYNKKKETIYIPHDFQKGYTTAFGGNVITDLSSHPQKNYGGSTAAGAYQVMRYKWWELNGEILDKDNQKTGKYRSSTDYIKKYKITDYQPESQDKICLIIMKTQRPNLIGLIIKNDIENAIRKDACLIWASLPEVGDSSHYFYKGSRQPATPMEICLEHYNTFLKEELAGVSKLHLKKGFLKEFDYDCCTDDSSDNTGDCEHCHQNHYDLTNTIKWQTQFDSKWGNQSAQNVACKKTCDDILNKAGLASTSKTNKYQTALENNDHSAIIINSAVSKDAIQYINEQLKAGNPVQVGVDHDLNYKGGTLNEGTTDHFVVIIGKGCDSGKVFYQFYDVGTRYEDKGSSKNNKLFLGSDNSLIGTTVYSGQTYTVSQVRKNSKI